MVNSPEWPDLPFVPARTFGTGRDGKSVQYVVIHYTAGAERNTSAEDGAAYDQRRTDGVSTHYFHDSDSTVQCVLTFNRANAAFAKGNRLGIQHELCGTAQTRAQWLDAASDATLTRVARQAARDCRKHGLPVRRLTPAEVRAAWYSWPNGPKGICGHVDITLAYPEDGGDHTDPGPEFPWDVFLPRVAQFYQGDSAMADFESPNGYTTQPDGVTRKYGQEMADLFNAVVAGFSHSSYPEKVWLVRTLEKLLQAVNNTEADIAALATTLARIEAKIDTLAVGGVDQAALAAATVDLFKARL